MLLHFQARKIKPVYLLNWTPSEESAIYFRRVDTIDAWLYSAFFVACTPPSVRVLATSRRDRNNLGHVYCHYLNEKKSLLETQRGYLTALKDNHMLNHTAAAVDCPVAPGLRPSFVSVTKTGQFVKPSNPLTVHYPPDKPSREFTLCFSPLHSRYNATLHLIQSIELNRIFGASHFMFYNFSISPETDLVLRQYEREGLATILQWPLPHLESWYYAQILAINDCIYRNKMTSRFVVVIDTDEFIVPNNHSNWSDLINDVTKLPGLREQVDKPLVGWRMKCVIPETETEKYANNRSSNISRFGSFMFRSSFFTKKPLSFSEQQIIKENKLRLTPAQKEFFDVFHSEPVDYLKRQSVLYATGARSKLIVRPETIVSHAIHKTVEHIAGYQTAYVDSKAAYLHHYRPYSIKSLNTFDVSALKFKDKLYSRLRASLRKFPTLFHHSSLLFDDSTS